MTFRATGGVARALGERVFAERLVEKWAEAAGRDLEVRQARLEADAGRLVIPRGIASDDVVVFEGRRIRAIAEVKASRQGFRYPIRSARKALAQLVSTLEANPRVPEAMFIAIDMQAHDAIVLRRGRAWWLHADAADVRAALRQVHDGCTWPGAASRR